MRCMSTSQVTPDAVGGIEGDWFDLDGDGGVVGWSGTIVSEMLACVVVDGLPSLDAPDGRPGLPMGSAME